MRERPILFSAPMVRVILAGRKTQTRRICKVRDAHGADLSTYGRDAMDAVIRHHSPCGVPGDRLWVRETFSSPWHHAQPTYLYRADDTNGELKHHPEFDGWKPSIHMPRAASRITLEVTGVRVERLREISEEDAGAEGLEMDENGYIRMREPFIEIEGGPHPFRSAFQELWESINGAGSWSANPWVWVVEFKRVAP